MHWFLDEGIDEALPGFGAHVDKRGRLLMSEDRRGKLTFGISIFTDDRGLSGWLRKNIGGIAKHHGTEKKRRIYWKVFGNRARRLTERLLPAVGEDFRAMGEAWLAAIKLGSVKNQRLKFLEHKEKFLRMRGYRDQSSRMKKRAKVTQFTSWLEDWRQRGSGESVSR